MVTANGVDGYRVASGGLLIASAVIPLVLGLALRGRVSNLDHRMVMISWPGLVLSLVAGWTVIQSVV